MICFILLGSAGLHFPSDSHFFTTILLSFLYYQLLTEIAFAELEIVGSFWAFGHHTHQGSNGHHHRLSWSTLMDWNFSALDDPKSIFQAFEESPLPICTRFSGLDSSVYPLVSFISQFAIISRHAPFISSSIFFFEPFLTPSWPFHY